MRRGQVAGLGTQVDDWDFQRREIKGVREGRLTIGHQLQWYFAFRQEEQSWSRQQWGRRIFGSRGSWPRCRGMEVTLSVRGCCCSGIDVSISSGVLVFVIQEHEWKTLYVPETEIFAETKKLNII